MLGVQFLHALAGNMGIDLRGREVTMAEQHLYDSQICAMVEQMGREGMAQCMRRKLLGDARLACITLDDVPKGLARHAVATPGWEQIIRLPFEQDLGAGPAREFVQPSHRLFPEGN